jgi:hypothetical protein
MNRREILTGAGALALTSCTQMPVASADPFTGDKLMADVEAYVGFGTHRTGSVGDLATSDWFAKHWRSLGYAVEQTDVTCPNADTHVAKLRIGDQAFDGFAQPPLTFTPEGGLTAPLAAWNAATPGAVSGKIAVVYVERAPGHYEARALRLGRIGDEVVEVTAGLAEGERVVTQGNLLLDSQSQIAGVPRPEDPAGDDAGPVASPQAKPAPQR